MRSRIVAAMLWIAALQGCESDSGQFEIRGRLIDTETGAPVSRVNVNVHLFNDAAKAQVSFPLEDEATFVARMPGAGVRLRVIDRTDKYRFFERNLEIPATGLETVVELVPTHFVLVKGRLLENGKAPRVEAGVIGGTPLLGFAWDDDCKGTDYDADDGSFEVRLPRTRVEVQMLDTGLGPVPPILDLTGVTVDVVVQDICLTPS